MLWSADEFRLVIPIHGLSECVIKGITNAPNGRDSADLREALPIANRRELAASVAMTP